jgi:thiol-disulfide isomerase/thioredoxin
MENLRSESHNPAAKRSAVRQITFRAVDRLRGPASFYLKSGLLLCSLAIPYASRADPGPDVKDVLKRTATAYQSLKSYQAEITIQTVDGSNVAENRYTETGSGASYRWEQEGAHRLVRVSDGKNEWTLNPGTNEYAKSASGSGDPGFIGQLAQIDQNVKDTEVADEELYTVNGASTKVYIVEVTRTSWPANAPAAAQSVTYSIDEKTFEVYKSITYTTGPTQIALYTLTQGNQPADESVFAFTPPASAKEVETLPAQPDPFKSILGTEAPDFMLKDAAGHSYDLHDFRGKVVVIDFVGSWCPPCLAQMPYMQQINDSYPPKDLEVFGLDIGEDAKQVNDLGLNSDFTFPLLLGGEPDVTARYFVDDYPTTYIIGRDDRIVFKATGTDNPGAFLAAVKAAVAKKN